MQAVNWLISFFEAGSRVEELELGVDLLKGIGCCWCMCEM